MRGRRGQDLHRVTFRDRARLVLQSDSPRALLSCGCRPRQRRTLAAPTSLETVLAGLPREALELLCPVLPLAGLPAAR